MNYLELRKLQSNSAELAIVYNKTAFLGMDKTIPIRQRLWHIDNDIYDIPLCNTCQENNVKWTEKTSQYRRFCSSKCSHNSLEVKTKTANTCLAKYGAKTNLVLSENLAKQKATTLQRYGVENISQSEYFKEKYKNTCMEKYGVSNVSKLNNVKEKINITHQIKYGRKRQSQSHIPENIIELKNNEELMRYWFNNLKMPVTEIAEKLDINASQLCLHFKNNLGIDIRRHNVSSIERKVGEYIDSLGISYETSNRTILKPKELDIVVPELKLAIEINGLAWHGEIMGKDKNYHLDKMSRCNDQGIRLIQITDEEWKTKQEIVKSRLSGVFGKNERIYARKCRIEEITNKVSKEFFEKSHIQGSSVCSIAYGLFYNEELVAVMSFCKSRYNKKYQWELLRYSNKLYTNVIGGASKLLNHFKKTMKPTSIISYCDLRWNTGLVYEKIGFTKINQSTPNYWYFRNGKNLESRVKYQKHKLSAILKSFDPMMTEWDNMKANGYDRIWDCGNLVFVIKY